MATPFTSQTVGLDTPAPRRRLPLPLNPSILFQAVEGGEQRSRLDVERPSRRLKNAFGDSGAMERLLPGMARANVIRASLEGRGALIRTRFTLWQR